MVNKAIIVGMVLIAVGMLTAHAWGHTSAVNCETFTLFKKIRITVQGDVIDSRPPLQEGEYG